MSYTPDIETMEREVNTRVKIINLIVSEGGLEHFVANTNVKIGELQAYQKMLAEKPCDKAEQGQ